MDARSERGARGRTAGRSGQQRRSRPRRSRRRRRYRPRRERSRRRDGADRVARAGRPTGQKEERERDAPEDADRHEVERALDSERGDAGRVRHVAPVLEQVRADPVAGPRGDDQVRGLTGEYGRSEESGPAAAAHGREHIGVPAPTDWPRKDVDAEGDDEKRRIGRSRGRHDRVGVEGSNHDDDADRENGERPDDREPLPREATSDPASNAAASHRPAAV